MLINSIFYTIKPLIPRSIQIFLRRKLSKIKRAKYQDIWPIDPSSGTAPKEWRGWPKQKKFALVLSHDVDTQKGHNAVFELIEAEKKLGFKSAFNFVPERYNLSREIIEKVKQAGFEVNIHGLKHDGKLFKSKEIFQRRAKKINQYIEDWDIDGFTAPSMICEKDWIHELNIIHSTCSFDTDPFEPQPTPSKTIFPFFINDRASERSIVELPYTLPQDHGLFIILQEKDTNIWKQKLDWICDRGGMALLNTHPDYMNFRDKPNQLEEYSVELYTDFLKHVKERYDQQYWHALPGEVAEFMKTSTTIH